MDYGYPSPHLELRTSWCNFCRYRYGTYRRWCATFSTFYSHETKWKWNQEKENLFFIFQLYSVIHIFCTTQNRMFAVKSSKWRRKNLYKINRSVERVDNVIWKKPEPNRTILTYLMIPFCHTRAWINVLFCIWEISETLTNKTHNETVTHFNWMGGKKPPVNN